MSETKAAPAETINFSELNLPEHLLDAVQALGYTQATPIQVQAIPVLMAGSDVLGQAQTGTGKTAAFALPLLAKIKLNRREPQILVLVPTRELALQVSEAFSGFAVNMPGINILPIYGGQGYNTQLSALRRGVHIVIGTPGRVMDHMRRETLKLDNLKTLILDEADEMLRMGFAEDVEWILQHVPAQRQIGLFSATMPQAIKAIAENHLHNPQRITVKTKTTTAATIKQFYCMTPHMQKFDTLTRILESEDSDAVIVFVRTKMATEELAEKLADRGFNAVAINGDIVQKQRERVIEHLKSGKIKILIATDVAARGIDVDRITHVINYDAPNNAESYTHRVGRTGRAGRTGTAIIFLAPRERYMLNTIERVTRQPIEELAAPSVKGVNAKRIAAFTQRITDALTQDISFFEKLITEYLATTEAEPVKVAAALAKLLQGDKEFLLPKENSRTPDFKRESRDRPARPERSGGRDRFERKDRPERPERASKPDRNDRSERNLRSERDGRSDRNDRSARNFRSERSDRPSFSKPHKAEYGMEQYRVEIGREDGLQPKNLVGAIANTTGIEGRSIGKIKIEDKFSLVDLPKDMPKNMLQSLARLKLIGKQMNIHKV